MSGTRARTANESYRQIAIAIVRSMHDRYRCMLRDPDSKDDALKKIWRQPPTRGHLQGLLGAVVGGPGKADRMLDRMIDDGSLILRTVQTPWALLPTDALVELPDSTVDDLMTYIAAGGSDDTAA